MFAFALAQYLSHKATGYVLLVVLVDLVIATFALATYVWWAPRTRHPVFLRALAVSVAIVGLGGVTICSGAFAP